MKKIFWIFMFCTGMIAGQVQATSRTMNGITENEQLGMMAGLALACNAGGKLDDYELIASRILSNTAQTDADERKAAQEKMIALNLAYEEALKLTASRRSAATNYNRELTVEEAIALADKMLRRDSPESALRQLMRTKTRTGNWYAMQGRVLMALDQFESAHQSYREAVRREPNNNVFRQGALDAAVALKKSRTLMGRIRAIVKRLKKR